MGATAGTSSGPCAEAKPWWNGAHIVSRCFNSLGEDAVCGAAHAGIVPFWSSVLVGVGARSEQRLVAFQSSPRGGELRAEYDAAAARISLEGTAETHVVARLGDGGAAILGLA